MVSTKNMAPPPSHSIYIKVSDFLNAVKEVHADSLPMLVLNHYKMERPITKYSENLVYAIDEEGESNYFH